MSHSTQNEKSVGEPEGKEKILLSSTCLYFICKMNVRISPLNERTLPPNERTCIYIFFFLQPKSVIKMQNAFGETVRVWNQRDFKLCFHTII